LTHVLQVKIIKDTGTSPIYYYNTTDLSTLRIIAYSTQGNSTYHRDIYTISLFTMIGL